MTFLQPAFLWGLLAVAIPVLIHLWHQKRAQLLPWAAMQWLREVSQQQQRGLRFDDWLLLVLRCLIIALISILLAQPVLNQDDTRTFRAVHLVQPDSLVTASFRFELAEARQKQETVVMLTGSRPLNPLQLQHVIDSLRGPEVSLHLYVRNEASVAEVPTISVPQRFSVHAALAPISQRTEAAPAKPFAGLKSPLNVRFVYRNPAERQTVKAALGALAQVYGLNLNTNPNPATQPDWLLTDMPPKSPKPGVFYTISGANRPSVPVPNVVWVADTLTPQTADWVANGQLPEWLGQQLLHFYKLEAPAQALTQQELTSLFTRTEEQSFANSAKRTPEQQWLLVILLVVIGAERWLALKK